MKKLVNSIVERLGTGIYARYFLWLFASVFLLRLSVLIIPELIPQECYYWNYSRHLAAGYFDHPPMTAWTIRFFCTIFGNTPLGIRMTAILYGMGSMLAMYLLGRRLFSEMAGFFSSLFLAMTPLGAVGGWFVTPDPALIFFWTASILSFHIALTEKKMIFWLLTGLFTGLAMLSKYPAAFLFVGYAIVLFRDERGRKALQTPAPYLALLVAIIAFSPQIIWNYQNDWASFGFQTTRRAGEIRRLRLDYFLGYIASQALVVTPVIYFAIVKTAFKTAKSSFLEKGNLLFLNAFALPLFCFFSFVGLFYWIKINWLAPSYITAAIAFSGLATSSGKPSKLLKAGSISAAILTLVLYIEIVFAPIPVTGEMMTVMGNKQLADVVSRELMFLPDSDRSFVFGWNTKRPVFLPSTFLKNRKHSQMMSSANPAFSINSGLMAKALKAEMPFLLSIKETR